ncbi:MAG: coenzyme F420-0:L-glutamate ligase [Dermatophilaceae bacterium]
MSRRLTVIALTGIPQVRVGDDLASHLLTALDRAGVSLAEGDVLAVSSKVVSKALGLTAPPADKDATVLAESAGVVAERAAAGHVARIVRSLSGPVMAAAGVDASNTGDESLLLRLPEEPDAVCRELHSRCAAATGVRRFGLLLTDTAGRPWRVGQTDFALGAHGVRVLDDLRGGTDMDGRPLEVTARALADELAAAADLVKGKARGVPAALVRGLPELLADDADAPGAGSLVRPRDADWFALGAQEAVRAALGVPPGSAAAQRVGIRGAGPETRREQVRRAVGVALATGLDAAVDAGPGRVEVSGPDPVVVGMVAARLLTALAGEEVSCGAVRHTATSVWFALDPEPSGPAAKAADSGGHANRA